MDSESHPAALHEYIEALIIAVVLALFVVTFIAQSYLVQGSSMEPTLHTDERLLVNKLVYRFTAPKAGDVVVFRYPADPRRRFVKRVVAVGGQQVFIANGKVMVDGAVIPEPRHIEITRGAFGPVRVPRRALFVLGDNRNNSEDSRFPDVGFVPTRSVVGRASVVYWPLGHLGVLRRP